MANTENLEVLYGGSWRKDEADFAKSVDAMVGHIDRLTKAAKGVKIDLGQFAGTNLKKGGAEVQKTIDELKNKLRELEKAQKDNARATIDAEKVKREEIKTLRERNKQLYEARKQQIELERAMKREEAQIRRNESAYGRLNNQYKQAAERAQNLGAEIELLKQKIGTTAAPGDTARLDALQKEFDQNAASAKKLHEQLLRIDESVGRSQRNVGNYKSQWNGLNFSIQQLVREVPSTAGNLAMLPLALSNNIGPLIDSIKQARVANEALKASGQATIPVWKQVASAIFSWQTALMAGIAILIAYSASADEAKQKTGDFAEALKSASQEYAEGKTKLEAWAKALQDAKTSTAEKQAILEEYNATLGDQMGKVKSVNELEHKVIELGPKYIETLMLRAKATAAISAATELYAENLKNVASGGRDLLNWQDQLSVVFRISGQAAAYNDAKQKRLKENTDETAKSVAALTKIYLEASAAAANNAATFGFDLDGRKNKNTPKGNKPDDLTDTIIDQQREIDEALAEMQADNLRVEADNLKARSENEQLSLEERLEAYQQYYNLKGQIEQAEYDKELARINAQNEKIKHDINSGDAPEAKKAEALAKAEESYQKQIEALFVKYDRIANTRLLKRTEDEKQILESSTKEQLRIIMQGATEIETQIRDSENRKLEILNTLYDAKLISEKEYRRQRKEIQANADNDEYKALQTYFKNYIDELERNGKLTAEIAAKLRAEIAKESPGNMSGTGEKKKGLFNQIAEEFFGELDAKLTDEQISQFVDTIKNAVNEIYSSLRQIQANRFAAEIQGLETEMDLIKKRYEQEVEYVNGLAITEEEKEKRLADLKAKNFIKEQDQQRRINAAKRRQAVAEQQAAIFEATARGAVAVITAFRDLGPIAGAIAAVAVGASIAAQISAIKSTPLPEYYKGTDSAQKGFAHVAERGAELVVGKDGSAELVSNPTIRYMEGGEKVFTAQETNQMLKNGALKSLAAGGKKVDEWAYMKAMVGQQIASDKRNAKEIVSAINKQKVNIHIHDNSYRAFISKH